MEKKKIIKKIVFIIIWIVIWQALSLVINNNILLVGPYETILALIRLIPTSDFWISILNSLLKITLGYIIGVFLGITLAYVSYKVKFIEDFLSPFLTFLKSVPVASFVIIVLIWAGNSNLAIIVSAMIVFPVMYSNIITGLKNTNKKLLEMSKMYRLSAWSKIRYLYFPELREYIKTSMILSSGMAWKSGVAAEVIAQPLKTIGNNMYVSKIYLETDKLFAWTLIIIVISKLIELFISLAFKGKKKHDKT